MTKLDWYFDFISPFAYMQWVKLRRDHADIDLNPRPVLFAALLNHWGQLGPAEIPGKREFTYRHVIWRAEQAGFPLVFPPAHPFNPLKALRLSVAAGNRLEVVDTLFRFIWREGRNIEDPAEFAAVAERLGMPDAAERIADAAVKDELRRSTEAAIKAGVYGIPTLVAGGELFWGDDATDLALAVAADPSVLERGELARATRIPVGIQRKG